MMEQQIAIAAVIGIIGGLLFIVLSVAIWATMDLDK